MPDFARTVNDPRNAESGSLFRHPDSPGKAARIIQQGMDRLGIKKVILKRLINRKTEMKAAPLPRSLLRKCRLSIGLVQGRLVWTLSPKIKPSGTVVLYLHGGAYYGNMSRMHWRLVEKLIDGSRASFIVPDYPLAPQFVCKDAIQLLDEIMEKLPTTHPAKRLVFMGDSAGGGLALGYAQKISREAIRQPEEIILLSPWLDVSMSNPAIAGYEDKDKLLSINDLKLAGKSYAGKLDLRDFRISPIYGDYSKLGRISLFTGSHDVLYPDALKLRRLMEDRQLDMSFYEYPGMFHDWALISILDETKDAITRVLSIL